MLAFNNEYRVFFKKLTALNERSLTSSQLRVTNYSINRDLLTKTLSSIEVLELPNAIEIGDVVVMYDKYGTVLFTGIVTKTENNKIECNQSLGIFDDNWKWNRPNVSTIENALKTIITNDYQNSSDSLMRDIFGSFEISTTSSTNLTLETQENRYVVNMENFLYSMYEKYGIVLNFNYSFQVGTPTIEIGTVQASKLTISNNVVIFRNFEIQRNVYETNKLIVYGEENGEYRDTFYATRSGITEDSSALNRPQKIKTNIIWSDDNINVLKASSLRNTIYSHEISVDLVVNNKMLDLSNLKLGQEADIYYDGNYFNSILTGYSMSMSNNVPNETVSLKFGLVRTSLTSKLYKKVSV